MVVNAGCPSEKDAVCDAVDITLRRKNIKKIYKGMLYETIVRRNRERLREAEHRDEFRV